jgi:ribosome-associated protein
MHRDGQHALAVEGLSHAQWAVLDYDDVVIGLFYEPARESYRLASVWSDGRAVPLPEPLCTHARDLRLHPNG